MQRHVRRQQQRVHPGQHGDRRRRHVRLVEPRPHDRHRSRGAVVAAVLDDAQRASRSVVLGSGVDLLADATVVVAEQGARTGDDIDGAAVVHRERVRDGPGEQSLVVDEERRVGAGVAVDALVVVAHAEHVERRTRQQADEQHVRRGEVLELVDQQVPARALHRAAELAVGEQRLDGGVDLLVEVDGAALGEPAAVRREQLGQPRDVVARGLDVVGVGETEADGRQALDVRPDRIGVRSPLPPPGQQRLDQAAHLRLVEHGRRRATVFGEHPQPERVERAHARAEVGRARPPSPVGPACCRRQRGPTTARSRGPRGGGAAAR